MVDGLTEEQKQIDVAVQKQLPSVLKLPEPDRSKCLMCLAYEYFNLDMEEKAFTIIQKADPNYFNNQLKEDMKDPDIQKIVMRILGSLMNAGYVKVESGKEE